MKQSVLRMLCAVLLLLLAVGIMAGAIAAIAGRQEVQSFSSVGFRLEQGQDLRIYNREGKCITHLRADRQGFCTSGMLEEGEYYAACHKGMVYFRIDAHGLAQVGGAAQEREEGILSFATADRGSVHIETEAKGQWYTYELFSQGDSRQQVLRCEEGQMIRCSFEDLPLGTYSLEENGRFLCTVELTEESPHATVNLP